MSAWLFRHKGRADKASDFIKPPVEGSHSSSFPSVKILHEAWKPGLRFDGFPIEEPPYAPLAQDIYDRSVMKRVSVAWEITGDIAVFGQGGHVLLDGELLDPPSPIASSIKRPSDADIAIARHGLPDAQMIDSAILFEHPWETSFFDAFFFLLPRIIYASEIGIDANIPLMLNARYFKYGLTKEILSSERLCCANRVRDSSCESSVVAGMYEQTHTPDLQDQELASLQ